jgi:hypothetical protein
MFEGRLTGMSGARQRSCWGNAEPGAEVAVKLRGKDTRIGLLTCTMAAKSLFFG